MTARKANMKETYQYSKSQCDKKARSIAAKVGVVTGSLAIALSWAIDMQLIGTTILVSPTLLTLNTFAGIICVAVSIINL